MSHPQNPIDMGQTSVEIQDLDKYYGSFQALKSVSLSITPGEFVVIVGPSGCGKSTLLRAIAGLEDIAGGWIHINDREVTKLEPRDRGVAMVFQNYALYPHMNVAQNMSFGLRLARRPKSEVDAAVRRAAEILRITPLLDKRPRHLSGGQRQRVAIGRAITRSPEVFLFDEPLSNLDAALRGQMRVELTRLHQQLGATMIYVTHDQVEAMTMADRIVLLRDGVVEQVGEPLELYNKPRNQFVAGFLGSPKINLVQAQVAGVDANSAQIVIGGMPPMAVPLANRCAAKLTVGDRVTVGLRPEHVRPEAALTAPAVTFEATAALEERLGRETMVYLEVPSLDLVDSDQDFLVSQLNTQSAYAPGARVRFGFQHADALVFDSEGLTLRWGDAGGP